jgi:hypothetical protein
VHCHQEPAHSPLAVSLHEKGVFLWPVQAWPLGAEIPAALADVGLRYHEGLAMALQNLLEDECLR